MENFPYISTALCVHYQQDCYGLSRGSAGAQRQRLEWISPAFFSPAVLNGEQRHWSCSSQLIMPHWFCWNSASQPCIFNSTRDQCLRIEYIFPPLKPLFRVIWILKTSLTYLIPRLEALDPSSQGFAGPAWRISIWRVSGKLQKYYMRSFQADENTRLSGALSLHAYSSALTTQWKVAKHWFAFSRLAAAEMREFSEGPWKRTRTIMNRCES